MKPKNKISYLDNAATTFPKPKSVISEVKNCLESYCGNAGRGSHRLSLIAANKIYECREEICELLNVPEPEQVIFVPSCTYGLNLVLKGILGQGDHVLISDMEHNAVWRPLAKMRDEGKITFDIFPALVGGGQTDEQILFEIERRLTPNTRLLICNHQSNICSYTLPIEKIGAFCKKNHIIFAIDGAQSVGHCNIDVQKMNVDMLIAPSHKGLYGIMGGGFVTVSPHLTLETLVEGGNGIRSLESAMPDLAPERYEAGTLPLPAIVGLCEGIKSVRKIGIGAIREHENELFRCLRDGLMNIKGVTVHVPQFEGSTLLFNVENHSCEEICSILDDNGICVRAGFHCAALAHKALNTQRVGGVRASFGIFNTKNDIDKLLTVVNNI